MLHEGLRGVGVTKARALSPGGAQACTQAAASSTGVPSGGDSLWWRVLPERGVMRPHPAVGRCCETP